MLVAKPSLMLGTIASVFVFSLLFLLSQSTSGRMNHHESDDHINPSRTSHGSQHKDRPLILFAYSESEYSRENLKFFVEQGLHAAADFIFIFQGQSNADGLIPKEKNIRIIKRDNTCFDLGAFGEVLKQDDLWKQYSRFITLNASLRGPFLPFWSNQCWSDIYLDKLTNNTKLVGMSANCGPPRHIQSMIWATDKIGMELMLYPPPAPPAEDGSSSTEPWKVGYSTCYADYWDAVEAELWTSVMIQRAGHHVKATMGTWSATPGDQYWSECARHPGDPLTNGGYLGTNMHPYETLFFKTNREIDPPLLTMMTDLHKRPSSYKRSYRNCR